MKNERITEELVREKLRKNNYYNSDQIIIDEQISSNEKIQILLKKASKNLKKNPGKPEFIIWHKLEQLVIIIECKADSKYHQSGTFDKPQKYAVDGALHYASFLKNNFNCIAIGASGDQQKNLTLSVFSWPKEEIRYITRKFSNLVSFEEYLDIFKTSKPPLNEKELSNFAKVLHNNMRDEAKLKESSKPLLVSALLLALDNDEFRKTYKNKSNPQNLANDIITYLEQTLQNSHLQQEKIKVLKKIFHPIIFNSLLLKREIVVNNPSSSSNNLLFKVLVDLEENVYPFMKEIKNIDILGKFYSEFIKYTGGDGKGLGIVLTPKHITDLFCKIANVANEKSIVIDICAGTGSFLISALKEMFSSKNYDFTPLQINNIYNKRLIGFEVQDDIFALACSNMIIRGDGKTNLFCENSLKWNFKKINEKFKPNVGLLNPPYSQKKESEKELEFVLHMLNSLNKSGIGVAIIPTSVLLSTKANLINTRLKVKLLEKHKLEYVISLPKDIFYPTASVNCAIIVFRAYEKNTTTLLYNLEDDGFKKIKYQGRVDVNNNWQSIQEKLLTVLENKDTTNHYTTAQLTLSAKEEWLPEMYIETNLTQLSDKTFTKTIKNFITFKFLHSEVDFISKNKYDPKSIIKLDTSRFKKFKLGEFPFKIIRAKGKKKNDFEKGKDFPFVSATSLNNGISFYIENNKNNLINKKDLNPCNVITIANNGSVGEAFFQPNKFLSTNDVNILSLKNKTLNSFLAMFLCTMIKFEKFRFNYGRKWGIERMKKSEIWLPAKQKSSDLDYDYMEKYIKSLAFSSSLT